MPTKIAINGFGRIGRPALKIALTKRNLEVVAINDLTDAKTLAYLLKYDSLYGIYDKEVRAQGKDLLVAGKKIKVLAQKDPSRLPWKKLKIDVVLECTGLFTDRVGAEKHLKAGAKKVIISAPSKSADIPTYIIGVNEKKIKKEDRIIDMASCTSNCLVPVIKVLKDNFGIKRGFMSTIHSYTNDQRLLDLPHPDWRRARAAGLNVIPTSSGAAIAVGKIFPDLAGKLLSSALRVPTGTGSLIDLVAELKEKTTAAKINSAFKKASGAGLKGILDYTDEPLVTTDIVKNSHSAIFDSLLTEVIDGNLIRVVAWYDNEWGYANRLVELVKYFSK